MDEMDGGANVLTGHHTYSIFELWWVPGTLYLARVETTSLERHSARLWEAGYGAGMSATMFFLLCCYPNSYNPFEGPNENPEAELPLTAGEYIYIYGNMDEDGFFEGRTVERITLSHHLPLISCL